MVLSGGLFGHQARGGSVLRVCGVAAPITGIRRARSAAADGPAEVPLAYDRCPVGLPFGATICAPTPTATTTQDRPVSDGAAATRSSLAMVAAISHTTDGRPLFVSRVWLCVGTLVTDGGPGRTIASRARLRRGGDADGQGPSSGCRDRRGGDAGGDHCLRGAAEREPAGGRVGWQPAGGVPAGWLGHQLPRRRGGALAGGQPDQRWPTWSASTSRIATPTAGPRA